MSGAALRETFHAVVDDLARSDFARRHNIAVFPLPLHFEELAAVARLLPPGGRCLDIGTGLGVVPESLLRLGYSVVTIDAVYGETVQRLEALGAEGHGAMIPRDRLPVPDGSVDVVLAGDVIEHLPSTPLPFLAELLRPLKPGGHLVLSTPNAVRLTVRLRVVLGHSNWPPVTDFLENAAGESHHLGHHKEYTAAELALVLRRAGLGDIVVRPVEDILTRPGVLRSFGDIRSQERNSPAYWGSRRGALHPFELLRHALRGATGLFPGLRSSLLATARKPGA